MSFTAEMKNWQSLLLFRLLPFFCVGREMCFTALEATYVSDVWKL